MAQRLLTSPSQTTLTDDDHQRLNEAVWHMTTGELPPWAQVGRLPPTHTPGHVAGIKKEAAEDLATHGTAAWMESPFWWE